MQYRPVPHEDMTTEEEIMLSAPYSDAESWERMIEAQLLRGISRFRGPPGLWEVVAARLSSSTGLVTTPPPSTSTTRIVRSAG